ncbi:MAG: hypothetical protein FJ096_04705 [Deltaproteobacteria bacterium]|nr:hypothetical protein [Deltaproteobacteria bacterium]
MKRLALALVLAGCESTSSTPAPVASEGVDGLASSVVPQPRALDPALASAAAAVGSSSGSTSAAPAPLLPGERLSPELGPAKPDATRPDATRLDATRPDATRPDATKPDAPRLELAGLDLDAQWSWPRRADGGGDEPRAKPGVDVQIHLVASGRMRLALRTATTTLTVGTALLGRSDRYGHLVVWPDRPEYRAVPPGSLRALLDDRRLDASPLSKASLANLGEGQRLGRPVRRVELTGSYGAITLELARQREAGAGGLVLCRTLVELGGIEPAQAPCRGGLEAEVPLVASYAWGSSQGKEALRFEVQQLNVHERDATPIPVPPAELQPRADGTPSASSVVLVTEEERAALGAKEAGSAKASAGKGALTAQNRGDRTMFLVVDGSPAAVLAPRARVRLDGVRAGRHRIEWRSFLADETTRPDEVGPDAVLRYPQLASDDEETDGR